MIRAGTRREETRLSAGCASGECPGLGLAGEELPGPGIERALRGCRLCEGGRERVKETAAQPHPGGPEQIVSEGRGNKLMMARGRECIYPVHKP